MVADSKSDFARRLNQALAAQSWESRGRRARLAKEIGVSGEAARKWLSGEAVPSVDNARKIAAVAGVDFDALMTGRGWSDDPIGERTKTTKEIIPPHGSHVYAWETLDDLPDQSAYVQVMHYDISFSAGDGCDWVEHPDNEPLVFRARWFAGKNANPAHCRAIYVHGDSMSPTLNDGDTVLIDTERTSVRDDRVFAVAYAGQLYIKRLFSLPGGGLELRSDNPRHPNREVSGHDLDSLQVLGEMIWRAG